MRARSSKLQVKKRLPAIPWWYDRHSRFLSVEKRSLSSTKQIKWNERIGIGSHWIVLDIAVACRTRDQEKEVVLFTFFRGGSEVILLWSDTLLHLCNISDESSSRCRQLVDYFWGLSQILTEINRHKCRSLTWRTNYVDEFSRACIKGPSRRFSQRN